MKAHETVTIVFTKEEFKTLLELFEWCSCEPWCPVDGEALHNKLLNINKNQ